MKDNIRKIRFIYVKASKNNNIYTGDKTFEVRMDVYKSLYIPENMTFKEACDLASYYSLKVERDNNLQECDPKGLPLLINNLKQLGFKEGDDRDIGYNHFTFKYAPFTRYAMSDRCYPLLGCFDAFVVDGDIKLFKKTDFTERYKNWFNDSIKEKDIEKFLNKKR